MVVRRRLNASSSPEAQALERGIHSHLAADAAFHGHHVFRERVAWLGPKLMSRWPGLRHANLAAHILVEMVLDGWIIHRERGRLDAYYACFTPDLISTAARWSANDTQMEASVHSIVSRFASVQFLRDYETAKGTTDRFVRLLTYSPFATGTRPDLDALVDLTTKASAHFSRGSMDLIEDVRAASDKALGA